MFGVDVFGYVSGGTYTRPTIGMKAEWTDYVVDKPTIYEKCISDDDFADGWSETLGEGDNVLSEEKQSIRAISVPEGYVATFFSPSSDDIEETQLQEFIGPINEDCLAEGLVVGKVVVAKMPTCSSLNRIDVSSEYDCGVCAEGYVEDTDENSETYGECIEAVDNTLIYAGIGGAALLLLIVALK